MKTNSNSIETLQNLIELKENQINSHQKEINMCQKEIKIINQVIKSLRDLDVKDPLKIAFDLPEKYTSDLKWEKKLLFLINKMNEAGIKELTEEILKRESDLEYNKTYKIIQQNIFKLHNNGKLIKKGDYASKYKLNKKGLE